MDFRTQAGLRRDIGLVEYRGDQCSDDNRDGRLRPDCPKKDACTASGIGFLPVCTPQVSTVFGSDKQ